MTKVDLIRAILEACRRREAPGEPDRSPPAVRSPAAGGGISGPAAAPQRRRRLRDPQTGETLAPSLRSKRNPRRT